MAFWKMAYDYKWVTINQLLLVVKTENNPYGDITADEYKQITGFVYPATA